MQRAWLVVLVTLTLASTATVATGDVAETATRQTAGTDAGVEDSIVLTQEYRLTPTEPGRIDLRWHVEIPERVSNVRVRLPPNATDVRSEQFARADGQIYRWSGGTDAATITFTKAVNATTTRTGPESAAGRLKFVDTGEWALIQRQPVVRPGYSYPQGDDPGVVVRNRTAGEGVIGSGLVFLGPHRVSERTEHGQTFRLVVPEAATLAPNRSAILRSLTDAAGRLRVGDRDERVTVIAAPTSVSWGVLGLQTGQRDFYVLADEPLEVPGNTWLHEYVHTRQDFDLTGETEWFAEASAEYYATLLGLEQEQVGFQQFRLQMIRGRLDRFEDVALTEPASWRPLSANYFKGALVAGALDRQIRETTDGQRSFQDVFRRVNAHRGPVTQTDFLEFVGRAGGENATEAARRYTETTAVPPVWSIDQHRAAFGQLSPRFTYELPVAGEGLRVRSDYRTGPLGTTHLVPGETLVVDVTVTNDGDTAGQYELDVTVDGTPIANRTGRLRRGETTIETITHTFSEPGIYRLSTGEKRLRLSVSEPARPAVTLATNRSQIRPGDPVRVTATVENGADRPGTRRVSISQNGSAIASERLRLAPGETATVTTTVTLVQPGTYRFEAGNRSASVRVAGETTGSSGPGLGIGVGLAGLAVATLVVLGRSR